MNFDSPQKFQETMPGTKLPANGGCVIQHDTSLSFAQNLRDTVVNFVKIILLLTFLPTGASDLLGKKFYAKL